MKPVVQWRIRRGSGLNKEATDYTWGNSSPWFLCSRQSWGTSSPWGTKWTDSREMFIFRRTSATAASWPSLRHGSPSMTRTSTCSLMVLDLHLVWIGWNDEEVVCLYFNKQYVDDLYARCQSFICIVVSFLLALRISTTFYKNSAHPPEGSLYLQHYLWCSANTVVNFTWCTKLHIGGF